MSNEPSLSTILTRIETAQSKIVTNTPAHDAAAKNTVNSGLPAIAIGASQGQYLSILCRMINAKHVLELGTLGGYSTLWFAGSDPDAKVTSIEIDAKHRDVAVANLESVKDRVNVIHGSALEVLPKMKEEGQEFDFVFIDADWKSQGVYYDWAVQLTRKGGVVYVDNAVRNITEHDDQCLVEKVSGDKRVVASLLPTTQTWRETTLERTDGFLIAYVL